MVLGEKPPCRFSVFFRLCRSIHNRDSLSFHHLACLKHRSEHFFQCLLQFLCRAYFGFFSFQSLQKKIVCITSLTQTFLLYLNATSWQTFLAVYFKVHKANLHDTKAGIFPAVSAYRNYSTNQAFCVDAGYRGSFVHNVKSVLVLKVDISPKIKVVGFQVIPKRWVVERTFAWLNNSRCLAKNSEQ